MYCWPYFLSACTCTSPKLLHVRQLGAEVGDIILFPKFNRFHIFGNALWCVLKFSPSPNTKRDVDWSYKSLQWSKANICVTLKFSVQRCHLRVKLSLETFQNWMQNICQLLNSNRPAQFYLPPKWCNFLSFENIADFLRDLPTVTVGAWVVYIFTPCRLIFSSELTYVWAACTVLVSFPTCELLVLY